MGKAHAAEHSQPTAFADAPHRAAEVAHAVDRKHGGLVERRNEECARHVRQVVLDIVELGLDRAGVQTQRLDQCGLRIVHTSRIGQAIADALEARAMPQREQHLLVEVGAGVARDAHMIELVHGDARLRQAPLNCAGRKSRAVLEAVEALLLGRGQQDTILDQAR